MPADVTSTAFSSSSTSATLAGRTRQAWNKSGTPREMPRLSTTPQPPEETHAGLTGDCLTATCSRPPRICMAVAKFLCS